mmetsp:Transcript_3546/g.10364  ORF Transcript_3546/g.10364 Transcript_3546/m.10364 type:complete len:84 (-) Transcript_3546:2739-2990(-)
MLCEVIQQIRVLQTFKGSLTFRLCQMTTPTSKIINTKPPTTQPTISPMFRLTDVAGKGKTVNDTAVGIDLKSRLWFKAPSMPV